jgi:hypothetical protein
VGIPVSRIRTGSNEATVFHYLSLDRFLYAVQRTKPTHIFEQVKKDQEGTRVLANFHGQDGNLHFYASNLTDPHLKDLSQLVGVTKPLDVTLYEGFIEPLNSTFLEICYGHTDWIELARQVPPEEVREFGFVFHNNTTYMTLFATKSETLTPWHPAFSIPTPKDIIFNPPKRNT